MCCYYHSTNGRFVRIYRSGKRCVIVCITFIWFQNSCVFFLLHQSTIQLFSSWSDLSLLIVRALQRRVVFYFYKVVIIFKLILWSFRLWQPGDREMRVRWSKTCRSLHQPISHPADRWDESPGMAAPRLVPLTLEYGQLWGMYRDFTSGHESITRTWTAIFSGFPRNGNLRRVIWDIHQVLSD